MYNLLVTGRIFLDTFFSQPQFRSQYSEYLPEGLLAFREFCMSSY